MQIGIIGGRGRMGSLFGEVFSRAGYEVLVAGRETDLVNSEAVTGSDIVMVSVPIRETRQVIERIAPVLREKQSGMRPDLAQVWSRECDARLPCGGDRSSPHVRAYRAVAPPPDDHHVS